MQIKEEKQTLYVVILTRSPSRSASQRLEVEDKFTYLGSIGNLQGETKEDIALRLGKARAPFAHMRPVQKSGMYSWLTKFKFYRSNVL